MPAKNSGSHRENLIRPLCDGVRTSHEIAAILNENPKYVQRIMKKYDLPRLKQSPRCGKHNPAFVSGRRIDRDGYAIVSSPLNHPYCRVRSNRSYGIILEHRLIVEQDIGRFLLPSEVVDHKDGLRLHNCPSNLRIFDSNAIHLHETISNIVPKWSEDGLVAIDSARRGVKDCQQVHKYQEMKKSGDARLSEILRTALKLGINSPFLLGTHLHLKKAGIFDFSRSNLERELDQLYQRYA